jgi:hypothetical protein
MTTKHTATLPDGHVVTRTSKTRVYPYVVARRSPEAVRLRSYHAVLDYQRTLVDRFTAVVTTGVVPDGSRSSVEDFAGFLAHAEAVIAEIEADGPPVGPGEWCVAGWTSRIDLADNLANASRANGYEVEVIDTVMK